MTPKYSDQGPVNCELDFERANLKGKTAIVTGGMNETISH